MTSRQFPVCPETPALHFFSLFPCPQTSPISSQAVLRTAVPQPIGHLQYDSIQLHLSRRKQNQLSAKLGLLFEESHNTGGLSPSLYVFLIFSPYLSFSASQCTVHKVSQTHSPGNVAVITSGLAADSLSSSLFDDYQKGQNLKACYSGLDFSTMPACIICIQFVFGM